MSQHIPTTAKPAERQKKLTILGGGLAKQSEPQHCKFQLESLLVPLTSNSPTVQAITKKDNIEILLFQYCSLDHVYFLVLPQQSSLLGLYGPVVLHLLGNKGKYTPAARPIWRINSSNNIVLPGKTYWKYNL